ncbi:hypothetical protein [Actinoplanes couchii]|uniref:DUF11 domain-containing protein n=1 Tax=Actinoplanes couchii TaxID=403638 RepID=A0ABQ3X882_9ACTN|nr:hypothetical protein [Actinoplanes couchii]MDR6320267.1 hypothetical protein [Actinoplanes couchii]GID54718.1 hypothetical protein Aco03nite_031220 [Actinoplanes couchii]
MSVTLALLLALTPSPVAAPDLPLSAARVSSAAPEVRVDQPATRVGTTVVVRLTGWPSGAVTAEICGNQAQRGSLDCAVAAAAPAVVGITRATLDGPGVSGELLGGTAHRTMAVEVHNPGTAPHRSPSRG